MQSYPDQHVCPVVFFPQQFFLHKQTYLFLELTDAFCSLPIIVPYRTIWLHTRITLMQLLLPVECQYNTILIHIYSNIHYIFVFVLGFKILLTSYRKILAIHGIEVNPTQTPHGRTLQSRIWRKGAVQSFIYTTNTVSPCSTLQ